VRRIVLVVLVFPVGAVVLLSRDVEPVRRPRAPLQLPSAVAPAPAPPPARVVEELLASLEVRDPAERWRATLALVAVGPDAVPHLLRRLTGRTAYPVGPPVSGPGDWEGRNWIAKAHARYALEQILPRALPALVACLADEELRPEAIAWLGLYGARWDGALPYLLPLLDEEPRAVMNALGTMGARAAAAVPAVAARLPDPAAAVNLPRFGAAAVPAIVAALDAGPPEGLVGNLDELGPHAAEVVPALLRLLASEDTAIQRDVIWCLGRIGPPAHAAVPALLALAEGADEEDWPTTGTRAGAATDALLKIGLDDATAGRLILRVLPSDHAPCAEYAERLGRARPDAARHVAALLGGRKWSAPETVAAFGPGVAPAVLPWLRSPDTQTRRLALETLDRLGPGAAAATEAIRPLLHDPEETVRFRAALALAAIGPEARYVIGEVEVLLDDPAPLVRLYAAEASFRMTNDPRRAAQACYDVLRTEPAFEVRALRELVDLGEARVAPLLLEIALARGDGPELVPEGMYSPDWETRRRRADAMEMLATLDALPPAALAGLTKLLDDEIRVRVPAALVLQRNGVADARVLPVLIEAVRPVTFRSGCGHRYRRPARLRAAAIDALAAMDASEAIPVLDAVRDESGEVGAAATGALRRLGPSR